MLVIIVDTCRFKLFMAHLGRIVWPIPSYNVIDILHDMYIEWPRIAYP
jgi:hypothetical protein